MTRIIGLDPGLRHTGWGIIESKGTNISFIACGVIHPLVNDDLAVRLEDLYQQLQKVIQAYTPCEAVVEETFVNKNPNSTLKLGMARGVVLLAPSVHKVKVFEYTANQIKKSVVGVGHASKEQVMAMVKRLLPKSSPFLTTDASDALAAALCHAHQSAFSSLYRL